MMLELPRLSASTRDVRGAALWPIAAVWIVVPEPPLEFPLLLPLEPVEPEPLELELVEPVEPLDGNSELLLPVLPDAPAVVAPELPPIGLMEGPLDAPDPLNKLDPCP